MANSGAHLSYNWVTRRSFPFFYFIVSTDLRICLERDTSDILKCKRWDLQIAMGLEERREKKRSAVIQLDESTTGEQCALFHFSFKEYFDKS